MDTLAMFEILKSRVNYNPSSWEFTWLMRENTTRSNKTFNTRFAGKSAGSTNNSGYVQISLVTGGKQYIVFAHRLAWYLVTGEIPDCIDHINHKRHDNRFVNLRNVSHRDNLSNQSKRVTNTTGVTGVYWDKSRSKWLAMVKVNYLTKNLGRFDSFDAAINARKEAEIEYGFHVNHGI